MTAISTTGRAKISEPESTTDTKTCIACFNSIDQRATKCPHCQSYQGLQRVAAFATIIGGAALLLVLIAGALFMELGVAQKVFPNNTNYANSVTIQSSRMFFSPADGIKAENGKTVSVVGRLTNDGAQVLGFIRLQVDVQNDENQIVDSFEGGVSGPLNPGESMTFRINAYHNIHLPESDYKSHTIIVRQARTGD